LPLFQYVGYYDRFYGGIKAEDGRDLFVKQGDRVNLTRAPEDGMWIEVPEDEPPAENIPEKAPETAPEPVSEPAPVTTPEPAPAPSVAVSEPPAAPVAPPVYVNPNTQPPAVVH